MIEIRHGNGTVLYTAEGAQDVRAALTEAVAARADLAGADLAGAYLAGADLAGAYLTRAYLTGANLTGADLAGAYLTGANLAGANLAGADLAGAYLAGAYLTGANLTGANLAGANLADAYLAGANLARAYLAHAYLTRANLARANIAGANLTGANLARARGLVARRVSDLHMLYDQPGQIVAYKLVGANGEGPFNGGIRYELGGTYEVPDADTDEMRDCAAGINLGTLPWCCREWRPGYRILRCEFTAGDIAAIPVGDGKFRVRRCTVTGEINLAELGLGAPAAVATPDLEAM